MTGRMAVDGLKRRLDATFDRAARAASGGLEAELLSDLARHLCVLVAGFLEQAVVELVLEHGRSHAHPTVQRYLDRQLRRRFTNVSSERLIQLMGSFSDDWRTNMERYLVDEYKDALNGVLALRNRIAHGGHTDVTIVRVRDYYARVQKVVDYIADMCVPI